MPEAPPYRLVRLACSGCGEVLREPPHELPEDTILELALSMLALHKASRCERPEVRVIDREPWKTRR